MTPEQQDALDDAIAWPWSVVIEPRPDWQEKKWIAKTPEIDGAWGKGVTQEEARERLAEMRYHLLAFAVCQGTPIPKPQGG